MSTADDSELEAAALIELYFEAEDPAERDAIFEQLLSVEAPAVREFLRAMMQEDEDEIARAAAAAELARRGDGDALALLDGFLEEPDDVFFFELALRTLAEVRGPAFYETLRRLWLDAEREADERREAMIVMEQLDPARAYADFVQLIDGFEDATSLADDQLELAILAFVRGAYRDATPALERMKARILATDMDADERDELVGLVQEGLDLLRE